MRGGGGLKKNVRKGVETKKGGEKDEEIKKAEELKVRIEG